MKEPRRILQIIPADGWRVVYAVDDQPVAWPLACWALIEDIQPDGTKRVYVGGIDMTGGRDVCGTDVADETSNFVAYLPPGDDPGAYADEAREVTAKVKPILKGQFAT